ncbi:MAG: NAD(P)-dependent oxidoreductase [Pseudomonadota bacterium]
MNIGFIGLGTMGFPIASHLVRGGYSVGVWNRTSAKSKIWLEQQKLNFPASTSWIAQSPSELAHMCEIIFLCVGNDNDVSFITHKIVNSFHSSKIPALKTIVDHSTISADTTRLLAEKLAQQAIEFIDAPLSGGQIGAEQGAVTVMMGGNISAIKQIEPMIKCYAKAFEHMGAIGCGQLAKMVNQICVSGVLAGLSEGILFAQRAGLNVEQVFTLIQQGAAGSWQMQHRAHSIHNKEFTFGFAIDWMVKDLTICQNMANNLELQLPNLKYCLESYLKSQHAGNGRLDTSALYCQLKREQSKSHEPLI